MPFSRLDNSRSVGDQDITSLKSRCAPKTKIEHKNRGLEYYFPFQRGDLRFPAVNCSGG